MTHPLTSENLFEKFWDYTVDADLNGEVFYTEDGMRKAADWQLEQIQESIDELVFEYTIRGNRDAENEELLDFISNLKSYMRPTTQENN